MKKQYEKPAAEWVSFALSDEVMGGSGNSPQTETEMFSLYTDGESQGTNGMDTGSFQSSSNSETIDP